MTLPALHIQALRKSYQHKAQTIHVLRGVDLIVEPGSWVMLTGKSGCGKTTLLRLAGTLDEPSSGNISCFGENVSGMRGLARARLRRRRIGFVFQSYLLLPDLDVIENVMLPGRLNKSRMADLRRHALDLLTKLGMDHRLHHHPHELSGGEQQRVAIARALVNDPDLILADEPTGNLDQRSGEDIMRILAGLRDTAGKTILMVTHQPALTQYANRTLQLEDGLLSAT